MTGVSQDSTKIDVRRARELGCEGDTFLSSRVHAGAVIATVNLQKHRKTNPLRRRANLQLTKRRLVIHQQIQTVDALTELCRLLDSGERYRKSVCQISETSGGKESSLGESRDGDAPKMTSYLKPRHFHALVCLDVRPKSRTETTDALGHARRVSLHDLSLQKRGGRL